MKFVKVPALTIVILALLSLHTYVVKNHTNGASDYGWYGDFIEGLTTVPETTIRVLKSNEVKGIPEVYRSIDSTFTTFNNLQDDVFGATSNWNHETNEWEVDLYNFKTQKSVKKWHFKKAFYNDSNSLRTYQNSEVANPIITADSCVIAQHIGSYNLLKINAQSELVWRNTQYYFHHAQNPDATGNIWICARDKSAQVYHSATNQFTQKYLDDLLVLIDHETGKTLFEKSIIQLLKENNYDSYALGMNGAINDKASKFDPTHLNDIQPVLRSGKYSQKGDVWVSMRNNSTIFLYRPSNNKIIQLITGPFIHQHDIDILNDSTITVFNNNYISYGEPADKNLGGRIDTLGAAQIIQYDFVHKTYINLLENQLETQKINTPTEGLCEQTANGYTYIEAQNNGEIYFYKNGQLVYRNYFKNDIEGYTEVPHWIRIYNDLKFLNVQ